jgi:hypothetical protein
MLLVETAQIGERQHNDGKPWCGLHSVFGYGSPEEAHSNPGTPTVRARCEDRDGKRRDDGPAQHSGALLWARYGFALRGGLRLHRLTDFERIDANRLGDVLQSILFDLAGFCGASLQFAILRITLSI